MSEEAITCTCPQCKRPFRVPANLQGKKIVCKGCHTQFVVQADQPGIATAPVARPAAAPARPAVAQVAAPVVAVASPAPAPVAPPSSDLPTIPFDDAPVEPGPEGGDPGASSMISSRKQVMEKVKIESSGPYMVVRLVTTGKMVHAVIEKALNEYAADGWWLDQILQVGNEAYAILSRERNGQKK